MQKIKTENASLKASNDNLVYINEKLNKALQKALSGKKKKAKKESSSAGPFGNQETEALPTETEHSEMAATARFGEGAAAILPTE